MSDSTTTQAPRSFWIISGIALVWNLLGVMAYVMHVTMSDEARAALPAAEQALYENVPAWATSAFAIAVFAGALGCVAMLLRKTWAIPLLLASLLGAVAQNIHSFFMSDVLAVYGPGSAVMPAVVIIIGIALVFYARTAHSRGWLR